MKLIMKFGGTSVADGEKILHVANLVEEYAKENKLVVVVSALAGVTDKLFEVCKNVIKCGKGFIEEFINEFSKRHFEAACKAVSNSYVLENVKATISETSNELKNVLFGISYLREITPRILDYVVSFGERLSAPIVWGALESKGIKSEWFTGGDAGIITDSNFGNANPLMELTSFQVKNKLQNLLEDNIIPVVTGYIAADQNGAITTLGRGGSDFTATILGYALDVDEVWIWTDVDGVMTADPKVEPKARLIHQLSYNEAMEMAYFGAKMIHPKAVEAVSGKGIPIRVRNTFNPQNPGTLIFKEQKISSKSIVKSISLIRKAALITVSGASMFGVPGTAGKVFKVLGDKNINVLMISQSSSEANISFVIPAEKLEDALNTLEDRLLGGSVIREVKSEDDICVITLVGAGMVGTPGVAARIFGAVAREKINVRMIAQGSSELSISFVVKEKDGERAVRALHDEFKLNELDEP
ncbi:MAG: aspartate kinase [Candidatus Bathyarchaeota archaeon]|nr:aspartate kinase [Candidatus Bathyarchaeota archaeon]